MLSQSNCLVDKLNVALEKYAKMANSNPHTLRALIPPNKIWRFFVDSVHQKKGRNLCFDEFKNHQPFLASFLSDPLNYTVSEASKKHKDLKSYLLNKCYHINEKQASQLTMRQLLNLDKGWVPYEYYEPGYLKSMHGAFQTLFSFSSPMTIDFIKQLHQLATLNVKLTGYDKNNEEKRDEFRKCGVHFGLWAKNSTKQGVLEFLKKGDTSNTIVIQTVGVDNYIYNVKISSSAVPLLRQFPPKKTCPELEKDPIPRLEPFVKMYSKSPPAQIILDSLAETKSDEEAAAILYPYIESAAPLFYAEDTGESLNIKIQRNIDTYYQAILDAKDSSINKIRAIVGFIQSCEQLHPFLDANCRTFCMLLLNHLLIQNGFPLALTENPNQFDLFSHDELILAVINGMENTFELIQDKTLFNIDTETYTNYVASIKAMNEYTLYFNECIEIEKNNRLKHKTSLPTKSNTESRFFKPAIIIGTAMAIGSMYLRSSR